MQELQEQPAPWPVPSSASGLASEGPARRAPVTSLEIPEDIYVDIYFFFFFPWATVGVFAGKESSEKS